MHGCVSSFSRVTSCSACWHALADMRSKTVLRGVGERAGDERSAAMYFQAVSSRAHRRGHPQRTSDLLHDEQLVRALVLRRTACDGERSGSFRTTAWGARSVVQRRTSAPHLNQVRAPLRAMPEEADLAVRLHARRRGQASGPDHDEPLTSAGRRRGRWTVRGLPATQRVTSAGRRHSESGAPLATAPRKRRALRSHVSAEMRALRSALASRNTRPLKQGLKVSHLSKHPQHLHHTMPLTLTRRSLQSPA